MRHPPPVDVGNDLKPLRHVDFATGLFVVFELHVTVQLFFLRSPSHAFRARSLGSSPELIRMDGFLVAVIQLVYDAGI